MQVCACMYKILCMNTKTSVMGELMCKNELSKKFVFFVLLPSPLKLWPSCPFTLRFYALKPLTHKKPRMNTKFPNISSYHLISCEKRAGMVVWSLIYSPLTEIQRLFNEREKNEWRKNLNWNCWSHNVNTEKKWNEAKEGPKIGSTVSLRPRFASIVVGRRTLFFKRKRTGIHTNTQTHSTDFHI